MFEATVFMYKPDDTVSEYEFKQPYNFYHLFFKTLKEVGYTYNVSWENNLLAYRIAFQKEGKSTIVVYIYKEVK